MIWGNVSREMSRYRRDMAYGRANIGTGTNLFKAHVIFIVATLHEERHRRLWVSWRVAIHRRTRITDDT